MDHLNSLPSTNAAATSAGSNTRTCSTCSSGAAQSPDSPSFADALKDEQRPPLEHEASQTSATEPASSPDLATLAANDSPLSEQGEHQQIASQVEESYDSVLQLLSELNAALPNQIKLGETPLVANNDLPTLPLAGIEGDGTIPQQSAQPTILSQDNQPLGAANPIATPTQGEGEATNGPAPTLNTNGQTNTPPQLQQSTLGSGEGPAQPTAANATDQPMVQEIGRPGQKPTDIPTAPLADTGSTGDQKAPVGSFVGTEGSLAATTPAAQQAVKTAQNAIDGAPFSATGPASPGDEPDQVQSSPTAKNDNASSGQRENADQSSSLIQKLKPLDQTTPLFQAQGGAPAQDGVKTLDLMAPTLPMSATGEVVRPAGISGIVPSLNTPTTPQVPIDNIAVHIAAQAKAGNQRFNIRLDPPELGRIDIRLEIGRDGQTLTHIAVDKAETLDLLRQDSRSLERALNSAGLDSREGGLSFSLREENKQDQQAGESDQDGEPASSDNLVDENEQNNETIERTLNVASGIDIKI